MIVYQEIVQATSVVPTSPRAQPNRQRFLQPTPSPTPIPRLTPPRQTPPSPAIPPPLPSTQRLFVSKIVVTGSTVFRPTTLRQLIEPYEGHYLTVENLREVADAITQLYLNRGYITSRAIVANQTVINGVVQITVIEGGVERIEIEGTHRLNPNYIKHRIQLASLKPLNKSQLEDQLRLLRADPLFSDVQAVLRRGKELGQSILIVRVQEANPLHFGLSSDNYSPPTVGGERFGVGLTDFDLAGLGDQLIGVYNRSFTGGANLYNFNYRLPLNPMNGTLQLSAELDYYRITDPEFSSFRIRGHTNLYQISYRQPFVRTPRQEAALSLGFAYEDGRTFLFDNLPTPFGIGPNSNGVSRTSVVILGQDYTRRYRRGALVLRSQFNFGVGLFDATINPHPIPDSRFFSFLGQAQRLKQIGKNHLLIAEVDLQLTPNSLLPSQQFVIGGGQSVRGYRQNARYGDNGLRFSVEDQIALQRNAAGVATFQVAPFVDLGYVWNAAGDPNIIPRQSFLPGAGLGLIWIPQQNFSVQLDYGVPLISLPQRGGSYNIQDSGFYFSINLQR